MSFASQYIEAGYLAEKSRTYIRQLKVVSPPADVQGKDHCCRSGVCCWRRPGELALDDVPRIAAFLGLTEQELFEQYLVVDEVQGRRVLLPRRSSQTGGYMLTWRETYDIDTPCVFLDTAKDNACKIHQTKPIGCRTFCCWKPETYEHDQGSFPTDRLLELGWDGVHPDEDESSYEEDV